MDSFQENYDFSPLLNLKLLHVNAIFIEEGILQNTHSSQVFFKWEKDIYVSFRIDEENGDQLFKHIVGQRLIKIDGPRPNHSVTSIIWYFEGGESIFVNIIGQITWDKGQLVQ